MRSLDHFTDRCCARIAVRAVAALTLAALAACASDRTPTAPHPDATRPLAAVVATGPTYVVNTTDDFADPDVGRGPTVDDGVCDDAPGLTVGARCSLRAGMQKA